ncbi:unnamed protein product, partial [Laminaria digitata]
RGVPRHRHARPAGQDRRRKVRPGLRRGGRRCPRGHEGEGKSGAHARGAAPRA